MGVGDRHSKRTNKPVVRADPPAHAVDDRELDDPFSAWDDDDAGAHRPSRAAQLAAAAQTRLERKPASQADAAPLIDPVAMQGIVISRARTLDDPLTTRVLAEVARTEPRSSASIATAAARAVTREIAPADPEAHEEPAPSRRRPTMRLAPSKLPAERRSESRTSEHSSDTPDARATEATSPEARDTRPTRKEIPGMNRQGAGRPIARDEPFRKR